MIMSNVIQFSVFQKKILVKSLASLGKIVNTEFHNYSDAIAKHGPDNLWTKVPELIVARDAWRAAVSNYAETHDRIANFV